MLLGDLDLMPIKMVVIKAVMPEMMMTIAMAKRTASGSWSSERTSDFDNLGLVARACCRDLVTQVASHPVVRLRARRRALAFLIFLKRKSRSPVVFPDLDG